MEGSIDKQVGTNGTRRFYELMEQAGGPRMTFHELRQTKASMLISGGQDITRVSKRLGHAKSSITLDTYAHLIQGTRDRAADLISAILFGDDDADIRALSA